MNYYKQNLFFFLNIQVEFLKVYNVRKYDEELFTNVFDVTNKFETKNIRVEVVNELLSNEDKKIICTKIEDKITRSLFSNDVCCYINFL